MTRIAAIYRDGVFQPLEPVLLSDQQRVHLNIEPAGGAETPAGWLAELQKVQAKIIERQGLLPDSGPGIAADRQR